MKTLFKSIFMLAIAAMALTSCEDVPMPYDMPADDDDTGTTTTGVAAGSGTVDDPFNCVAANELAATLSTGETTDEYYYIKGIVVSVTEEFTSSYGNATFYISDDGTTTGRFYVYRSYYLGNVKWTTGDTQIQAGDEVVVCARIMNYSGTYETAQYYTYLYSLNGVTAGGGTTAVEAAGRGTAADPYNVAAANEYLANEGDQTVEVYVKGIVSQIDEIDTSYGNATYYISDDGTTTNQFYVYRGYALGNVKFTSTSEISVGDEVVICGKLVIFYNTYEFTQGNYIYSLNGSTGSTTTTDAGYQMVTSITSGKYIIAANTDGSSYVVATPLSGSYGYIYTSGATLDNGYLNASSDNEFTFTDTGNGYTIQDGDGRYYYMTGTYNSFNVSTEVPESGHLWNVTFNSDGTVNITNVTKSKTLQYSSGYSSYGAYSDITNTLPYLFSATAGSSDGNGGGSSTFGNATVTKDGNIVTITSSATASSSIVTCDLSGYGWANAASPESITLDDGTTISFAQEEGYNGPKFYTATKGVRMYALNSMTIAGSKAIAKVVLTCDYSGSTYYVGNDQLYTSMSGNTWKVVNDYTSTSGGTQLRVQTIEITYAE